jgi:hypothetical protein
MSDPEVRIDTEPSNAVDDLRGALQRQLASALRVAVTDCAPDAAGTPVDQVYERLVDGIRTGLHPDIARRFVPDERTLRQIAGSLSRGEIPPALDD